MTVHLSKSRVASSLFIIIPPSGEGWGVGGANPIRKKYISNNINEEGLLTQTTPPPLLRLCHRCCFINLFVLRAMVLQK